MNRWSFIKFVLTKFYSFYKHISHRLQNTFKVFNCCCINNFPGILIVIFVSIKFLHQHLISVFRMRKKISFVAIVSWISCFFLLSVYVYFANGLYNRCKNIHTRERSSNFRTGNRAVSLQDPQRSSKEKSFSNVAHCVDSQHSNR